MEKRSPSALVRARDFLRRDIWRITPRTKPGRAVVHFLRTLLLVLDGFRKDNLFTLSAALTFKVVFAVVPLIAVALAVLKGAGGMDGVVADLKMFLIDKLAQGTGPAVAGELDNLAGEIDATAIGLAGFAILIWTALSLLMSIEAVFNRIWGVALPRPLLRRLTIYWTILTLGPLLVALSLTMSTFVRNQTLYLWLADNVPFFNRTILTVTPFLFGWLLFSLLYMIMPNTRVRFFPALVGALIAGTALELTKDIFLWYNANVVPEHHLYGSLGAIPVFLIWIYASWCITLFGAEVSFAIQNVRTYRREIVSADVSQEFKEQAGLYIMIRVVKAFLAGEPPPTAQALSERLNTSVRLTNDLVARLTSAGLLRELAASPGGLVPGSDPSLITVAAVLDTIHRHGMSPAELPEDDILPIIRGVMKDRRDRLLKIDGGTNLRYLAVNGVEARSPEFQKG